MKPLRVGGLGGLYPRLLRHVPCTSTDVLAFHEGMGQDCGESVLLGTGFNAGLKGVVDHGVVGPAAVDVHVHCWTMPRHLSCHPGADEGVLGWLLSTQPLRKEYVVPLAAAACLRGCEGLRGSQAKFPKPFHTQPRSGFTP